MRIALPVVALSLLAASTAAAEIWQVREGAKGAASSWNVTISGDRISGVTMLKNGRGAAENFQLVGQTKDGGFQIERIGSASSDRCIYVAKGVSGKQFSGTAICNGQQTPWLVVRP